MSKYRSVLIHLFLTLVLSAIFSQDLRAQKIIAYFNHPVNTSVSTGVNAIYLNQTLDDTLIAYINRAHYTIDVAVYNFVQSGNMSHIDSAINNAYARGVNIRWICNGSSSNTGLTGLNSNIHTLASPTTSAYGIMHNKFMVIDGASANPGDAIVWTGSCNWDAEQFNSDVNNVIIFRDSALAHAYTTEFNEMWGGTALVPDLANSKFGPFKTNNTPHLFNIGGTMVEQYFSPSDGTNSHIINAIGSANDDLYFGVYTFTEAPDADSIQTKFQSGVYTAGIMDQYSTAYAAYGILNPVMGNMLKIYTQSTSIYHSKMLIVDPCSPASDPLVETGSHNWSVTADTKNDENIVIVHNDTLANIYYQSFYQNFLDLGGTLTSCVSTASIQEAANETNVTFFPNPANDRFFVSFPPSAGNERTLELCNMLGETVYRAVLSNKEMEIDVHHLPPGIYVAKVSDAEHNSFSTNKLIIER